MLALFPLKLEYPQFSVPSTLQISQTQTILIVKILLTKILHISIVKSLIDSDIWLKKT